MNRELLTISRMNTLAICPRRDYYQNELGLRPIIDADNLRFGTSWHEAMQARWQGKNVDDAFAAALKTADGMDEKVIATISGLLAGYYNYWGNAEIEGEILPEIEFRHPIERSLTFDAGGKIDCILKQGGKVRLVEHKTTKEDVSEGSEYWQRTRYNNQLFQYYLGARALGYEVDDVIYDVVRKPMMQQKTSIPVLDEQGKRIVVDSNGQRVFKKNGEPRESGDNAKGYVLQTREETTEEYSDRLFQDCKERPEFYFGRKEIPILIQDLESYIDYRLEMGKQILYYRNRAKKVGIAGWPRNVQFWSCSLLKCPYAGFCLQDIPVDVNNPPPGYEVKRLHQELKEVI